MGCMLAVQAQQHPCVYVSPSDKVTVRQKVKNEPWAGEAFAAIRSKVEKYVDRHQTDPEWIISRLAMYWKEGERYTQCYLKKQNWDRGDPPLPPLPPLRFPTNDQKRTDSGFRQSKRSIQWQWQNPLPQPSLHPEPGWLLRRRPLLLPGTGQLTGTVRQSFRFFPGFFLCCRPGHGAEEFIHGVGRNVKGVVYSH